MLSACVCPGGCVVGEGIDGSAPEDGVRLSCSGGCGAGGWAHLVCWAGWEASGGGRECGCGGRLVRSQPNSSDEDLRGPPKAQRRRRTNPKQPLFQPAQTSPPQGGRHRGRAASTGTPAGQPIWIGTGGASPHNSPPHSFPHPRRPAHSHSQRGPGAEFFSDSAVGQTGSIFARRQSLQSLRDALPAWKLNGMHIKLEDDCPQGNDDTRIFLLTTLGDHKMREMPCVLCQKAMRVFDKYPLVDGTFFLSPVNHRGEGLPVRHETKDSFLHGCCVGCLERGPWGLECGRCGRAGWWVGASLVLGSLYSFDILSSAPCCAPECAQCGRALPLPDPALRQPSHYSAFSELSHCPHCRHRDSHYVRPLRSLRLRSPDDARSDASAQAASPPPLASLHFAHNSPPPTLPSHQLCTA